MKIKAEHLEHLRTEINKTLVKYPNVVEEYEQGLFPRSDKVKDLQRRFCFLRLEDLFWHSKKIIMKR